MDISINRGVYLDYWIDFRLHVSDLFKIESCIYWILHNCKYIFTDGSIRIRLQAKYQIIELVLWNSKHRLCVC